MVNVQVYNSLKKLFILLSTPFNRPNNELYFLYGHFVSAEHSDLNVAFELLKKLNKKVAFLDFEESCEIVKNDTRLRHPAVCFSFDDGFEEIVNGVCPMIKDFGANSCVFINPGFIDGDEFEQHQMCEHQYHVKKNPASWKDLSKFVSSGGVVGSHTVDHIRLVGQDSTVLNYQIVESKRMIEAKLDIQCDYFAWPYGTARDISDLGMQIALENYKLVFSAIRSKKRSFINERVINRDHFELGWKAREVEYFLSRRKLLTY